MPIERIGSGLIRPFPPADVTEAEGAAEDESPSERSSAEKRSDSVELSKQGLARAAEISEENSMAAERETEIRTRIEEAFYDEPSVAQEVARRLMDSGDLLADPKTTT